MDRGRPRQVPVDPGEFLGSVYASHGLVRPAGLCPRELNFGLMEKLATLCRRGLARPVRPDLVGIVPESEIKAF